MPLDFALEQDKPRAAARRHRGKVSYLAGLAAEDGVARHIESRGMTVVARRWRGKSGEIDLVARDGAVIVFVEVKKSRSHAEAAQHLGRTQQRRLWAAGEEFLALSPKGSLTEVRFDVALVDSFGAIEIIENALMAV